MPHVVTSSFKSWLKSSNNIKLGSIADVTQITYKGLTNFDSLQDFDKKSIESLTSNFKENIAAITADAKIGSPLKLR